MDPHRMVGAAVLSVTSLLIAAANEPSRVQRGLFIAAVVVVMGAALWWVRRRADAARWRQRRDRVFDEVQQVEVDSGAVLAAPDAEAASAAWSRLEPRTVICSTELADLAQSGTDPVQAGAVRAVRADLAHLSDQLRQVVTGGGAASGGASACEAARGALRASLTPPPR